MRRARLIGWLALAAVLVAALAMGVADDGGLRTPEERARNLAETIACPACDGQSVAESDAAASRGIRTLIAERIAQGASDDAIRDELVATWGEPILLTPDSSGVGGLVWVPPVVALVLALAGVGYAFWRWQGTAADHANDTTTTIDAPNARTRVRREPDRTCVAPTHGPRGSAMHAGEPAASSASQAGSTMVQRRSLSTPSGACLGSSLVRRRAGVVPERSVTGGRVARPRSRRVRAR